MAQAGLQAALPREMYVDEHMWPAERETVLYGQWYCLGRTADLGLDRPQRVVAVDVVGESVIVACDEDGRLHASYNVCRHRGSQIRPIDDGTTVACPAAALRCPYHSWTYALDGRLLHAPHTDLDGHHLEEFHLSPVGVDTWSGFVFVHLTPERATPLPETVARAAATLADYGIEGLVTGSTMTYDVAANYKVLLENYNECYHCGPVHPELCRLVPAFAGGATDLSWEDGVPHREGTWTFTATGTSSRAALAGLTEQERTRHKGELAYPNLMLSASADHVAAFVLSPRAVDRTRVVCSLLFAADEASQADFDPHAGHAGPGPRPRRRAARAHAGPRGPRPRGRRRRGGDPRRRAALRRPRRHRRRLGQRRARRPRRRRPARGDAGAGHLLPARAARGLRAGPAAAVDLDGRPELLRLPLLRRADREGGPGLRRPSCRPGRSARPTRTRRWNGCSPTTCVGCCPAAASRCGHFAASTP